MDSWVNSIFTLNYAPCGPEVGFTGSEEFMYTGKSGDSSAGLYYFGARFCDASAGRFIAEDPYPGRDTNPVLLVN